MAKCAGNQAVTTTGVGDPTTTNTPAGVTNEDSTDIKDVSCSDKPDNKSELAEIIEAWPKLPDAICSAIVAIVRASLTSEQS